MSKNPHAVALGRLGGKIGGKAKSLAKAAAARANAKKGGYPKGRPRKQAEVTPTMIQKISTFEPKIEHFDIKKIRNQLNQNTK